jgi:hypothetical protein
VVVEVALEVDTLVTDVVTDEPVDEVVFVVLEEDEGIVPPHTLYVCPTCEGSLFGCGQHPLLTQSLQAEYMLMMNACPSGLPAV